MTACGGHTTNGDSLNSVEKQGCKDSQWPDRGVFLERERRRLDFPQSERGQEFP